ncbi:uncharacterized protein [Engystomops pustulosus]|uniref:uncharacterized protein n=1 Tax=Engystomops pustulosus TaxID=76066 RepID=UPI003AFB32CB
MSSGEDASTYLQKEVSEGSRNKMLRFEGHVQWLKAEDATFKRSCPVVKVKKCFFQCHLQRMWFVGRGRGEGGNRARNERETYPSDTETQRGSREMDSKVTVLELQKDFSVTQHEVPLRFPRVSRNRLVIVTNQRSHLHLLSRSAGDLGTEEGGVQEKNIFHYGVSTKIFALTGPHDCEVHVLLKPSEISRLSSNFNLTGFVISCLTKKEYQESVSSIIGGHEANVTELCRAAGQFCSFSEDNIVDGYCEELIRTLNEKVGASFVGQEKMEDMRIGALVALVAAELAASVPTSFDYRVIKDKTQEDQGEQIQQMIKVFDVMAELLTVSHQGKRVQIIFRNPCPDNWASGGKKSVQSGETFIFGLCHKVVSISENKSEIQFLQNLQESYDLVAVFHLPAFVEHLLMTSAWRNKIERFLKEEDHRKEIALELSSLAERFICSKSCPKKTFVKEFQEKMIQKWSGVDALSVGDEIVCSFGILVAILAAVTTKSVVDSKDNEEVEETSEELVDTVGPPGTTLDDGINSFESITTGVADEHGGAQPNLYGSPDDLAKIEHKGSDVGIGHAESKISSTDDPGTADQGDIKGSPKAGRCDPDPPGPTLLVDIVGAPGTTLDDGINSFESITTGVADEHGGAQPNLYGSPDDLAKVEHKGSDVGIGHAESKISSTDDPGTADQGDIKGSPKAGRCDPDPPGPTLLVDIVGAPGTTLDDGINSFESITTGVADEHGGAQPNLYGSPDDLAKVEHKSGDSGIGHAESMINSSNDPGTGDQGDIKGSPKAGRCVPDPSGPEALNIVVQKIDNDDGNDEFVKNPGTKFCAGQSSPTSSQAEDGLYLQGRSGDPNLDDSEVDMIGRVDQPSSIGAGENKSAEVGLGCVTSKIVSTHDQGTPDHGGINSSAKTREPPTEPPCADEMAENHDVDKNIRKYLEAKNYDDETEAEGGLHRQGRVGAPNLDGLHADRDCSTGGLDKALETKDSSRNRGLNKIFIGLMCLLVVAMLTNVLPQSLGWGLVAIILGLLALEWITRQQPLVPSTP